MNSKIEYGEYDVVEDNEEGGYTIPCEVKTLSGNDTDIPYMR